MATISPCVSGGKVTTYITHPVYSITTVGTSENYTENSHRDSIYRHPSSTGASLWCRGGQRGNCGENGPEEGTEADVRRIQTNGQPLGVSHAQDGGDGRR